MDKATVRLIEEIEGTITPKLFNIDHGTASEREKQVVQECLGFLSIIKYSRMKTAEVKQIWDESNLGYA